MDTGSTDTPTPNDYTLPVCKPKIYICICEVQQGSAPERAPCLRRSAVSSCVFFRFLPVRGSSKLSTRIFNIVCGSNARQLRPRNTGFSAVRSQSRSVKRTPADVSVKKYCAGHKAQLPDNGRPAKRWCATCGMRYRAMTLHFLWSFRNRVFLIEKNNISHFSVAGRPLYGGCAFSSQSKAYVH